MKCLISPGTKSATESAGRGRDTCHHVAIHVDAAAAFFLVSELFAFGRKKSVVVLGGNPRERSGALKKFLGRNFRREMK